MVVLDLLFHGEAVEVKYRLLGDVPGAVFPERAKVGILAVNAEVDVGFFV